MKRLILSLVIAISALSWITPVSFAEDSIYIGIKKECINAAKKDSALIAEVGIAKIDSLADLLEKFDFSAVNKVISEKCNIPKSLLTKHPDQIKFALTGRDKDIGENAGVALWYADSILLNAESISLSSKAYLYSTLIHEYIHCLTLIDSDPRRYRGFKWTKDFTPEDWKKKVWSYSLPDIPRLLNEGATDWLMLQVYKELYDEKIKIIGLYEKPTEAVQKIANIVGPEVLMYAYLNGDADSLQTVFNARLGENAWQEYLKRLSVCNSYTEEDAQKILSITESFINSSEFSFPKPSLPKPPIRPVFF